MERVIRLDPTNKGCPDDDSLIALVKDLRNGAVIIYPTETVYGLGADCNNENAVRKLFMIKNRDKSKPISIIAGDISMALCYVENVSETAKSLMDAFWPGPLTLVFSAGERVNRMIRAGTDSVGVRVPGSEFCRRLALKLGNPITSTSVNISGEPECRAVKDIPRDIKSAADIIVDGGRLTENLPSTVVSVVDMTPVILREGAISTSLIEKYV